MVRIAFDRPAIRNAFRPHTVDELYRCIDAARCTPDVAALILTGNGPSPRDGGYAFCSGGDQRIRGAAGYQYESQETSGDEDLATDARREHIEKGRLGRLHILEVQRLMRATPNRSSPPSLDGQPAAATPHGGSRYGRGQPRVRQV